MPTLRMEQIKMSGDRKTTIQLPEELRRWLKTHAAQTDTTMAEIIIRVLREYQAQEGRK